MTSRLYKLLLAFLASGIFARGASTCYALSQDQILGRDLASALPEMSQLPADLKLGYSPAPGVQRLFRADQLQRLAARFGINTKITTPLCFAWPLQQLSKEQITAAIRKSLSGRQAEVEVAEFSHVPAPQGELRFPLQGLSAESGKAAIWNGFVTYGSSLTFKTWALVKVTVRERYIIASKRIGAGEIIFPSDLEELDYRGPLTRAAALHDRREAAGKAARRPINLGAIIVENMLAPQPDVEKEQLVTVRVHNGAAHIETQGIAEDGGCRGNVIRVRNPKTGRIFRARIDDHGVVTVVPGGFVGLVAGDKTS